MLVGLWSIPSCIVIGLRQKLATVAQPAAQIAALVPATALLPIVSSVLAED
jgi:NitT/TauT family transport system permease protein